MYEERNNFSIRSLILQILIVILFVFIMIWLFPSKEYMDENFVTNDELIERLQSIYGRNYASNVESMRDAAKGYFTNDRLPKKVGESATLTLGEMLDKKLVLGFIDSNGKTCDSKESYVKITKMDNEYQLKVQLTCSDYSDYIIDYLGCYNYCNDCGKTPSKPTVKPTTEPTVNKKYNYKYSLTTQNTYSDWSNWSEWSTKKVTTDALTQVQEETRQVISGYQQNSGVTGYKTESYTDYVTETYEETEENGTTTKLVDSINATYSGYYTDWRSAGYETTYDRLLYSNDTTRYTLTSTDRYLDCNDRCKYVTVRYYDVEKRTWNQGNPSCPSGYSLEGSKCNKYETETDYITVTRTRQVPVTKTRQVPVYGTVQGEPIYKTMTYYRYRTRKQLTTASTVYKWSNSKNDETLLNNGYIYTGYYQQV